MQSKRIRWQEDIFVACALRDLVPDDHILRRMDEVLDLDWLHEEVAPCYCQNNGRASIDPESALRLMLAGFVEGIVHDRKLMRRAQTDLAFRWFIGYRLDEKLPDHSSLTRIRQRWGAERFRKILVRTVQSCMDAGLIDGTTVHVDATLLRADVSWASLTTHYADQVIEQNASKDDSDNSQPPAPKRGRPRTKAPKNKKRSTTDPDATMSTSSKRYHLEPTFKQHTAVDDKNGVIVDIAVDTGEASEGKQLLKQIGRIEQNTGVAITTITADAGYAHAENSAALEQGNINAIIPPQRTAVSKKRAQRLPARRFKFDAHHDRVKCPNGNYLTKKGRGTTSNGYWYRSRSRDCSHCALRDHCIPEKARTRTIFIGDHFPSLLRARRKKEKGWDEATRNLYDRHRWWSEGTHGRAKVHHGLRRAARRGLDNVAIQAYLTAAVMNLKVLVAAASSTILAIWRLLRPLYAPKKPHMATTTQGLSAA